MFIRPTTTQPQPCFAAKHQSVHRSKPERWSPPRFIRRIAEEHTVLEGEQAAKPHEGCSVHQPPNGAKQLLRGAFHFCQFRSGKNSTHTNNFVEGRTSVPADPPQTQPRQVFDAGEQRDPHDDHLQQRLCPSQLKRGPRCTPQKELQPANQQ